MTNSKAAMTHPCVFPTKNSGKLSTLISALNQTTFSYVIKAVGLIVHLERAYKFEHCNMTLRSRLLLIENQVQYTTNRLGQVMPLFILYPCMYINFVICATACKWKPF